MKIKNYIIIFAILITIIGCNKITDMLDKDNELISDTSVYPIFVLTGGEVMVWDLGKAWVEPGYVCSEIEEGENDLTVTVDNSEMNVNERGLYSISYTATNKFGYEKTVYRSVLVTEGVNDLFDISGRYTQGYAEVFMNITESEIKGFWYAENVNKGSKPIATYIADLGDKTYVITKTYYHKRITDLLTLHIKGTGYFDDTHETMGGIKFEF